MSAAPLRPINPIQANQQSRRRASTALRAPVRAVPAHPSVTTRRRRSRLHSGACEAIDRCECERLCRLRHGTLFTLAVIRGTKPKDKEAKRRSRDHESRANEYRECGIDECRRRSSTRRTSGRAGKSHASRQSAGACLYGANALAQSRNGADQSVTLQNVSVKPSWGDVTQAGSGETLAKPLPARTDDRNLPMEYCAAPSGRLILPTGHKAQT